MTASTDALTDPTGEHRVAALVESVHGLRQLWPARSAHVVVGRAQWVTVIMVAATVIVAGIWRPTSTLALLTGLVTVGYAVAILFRVALVWAATRREHRVRVNDEEARAVPDDELPVYTVLVPAYREPQVIGLLLEHLAALDYPTDKLDVKLLLEADDEETITAARAALTGPHIEVVVVPEAAPRTKPKACNYGLRRAQGELVTIYDVEDIPEPLQLRRAVVALRRLGPTYACLQAELGYINSNQNWITRWFTLEYGSWFRGLLPGLTAMRMPIPLGGTSNHFRTDVLRRVGAWDPFNVTEDADVGIRLARLNYDVGVLDSVTLEEANSDFINWIKQRSRWYKGYLVTWIVHMRSPRETLRQLGWRGLLGLNFFVGATPVMALLNPLFWVMTVVWFVAHPTELSAVFVVPFYYVGLVCLVFGNIAMIYLNVFTARTMGRPDLLGSALLFPVYWVMMSIAAAKAALQLLFNPSFWEKTTHGLHLARDGHRGA
jgi:cellulose synthase/poly-beta-1,6-N-acetylglucosamine synthase-like glycosyltransferase